MRQNVWKAIQTGFRQNITRIPIKIRAIFNKLLEAQQTLADRNRGLQGDILASCFTSINATPCYCPGDTCGLG